MRFSAFSRGDRISSFFLAFLTCVDPATRTLDGASRRLEATGRLEPSRRATSKTPSRLLLLDAARSGSNSKKKPPTTSHDTDGVIMRDAGPRLQDRLNRFSFSMALRRDSSPLARSP